MNTFYAIMRGYIYLKGGLRVTETQPTYYITTPIYYPSGRLHIGNTYSTLVCDAMARYKRLMNYDVYFLTGMDEHGQKIEAKAEQEGIHPQQYVDEMAAYIKDLWEKLEITYDGFIRTTDKQHVAAVQQIFERLLEQGDIYLGEYSGWYSVSDEEFFTVSQLIEVYRDEEGNVIGGVAPSGHEVKRVQEASYFFKLSKYADRLVEYYEAHPDFLVPAFRKNEMINNFIKPGLEDLAVSRTTFSWGVPVKSNPEHVVYVWIDALSNYISALGYGSEDTRLFDHYWPADVHVIGKDISRFHMIYWPALLMALDLPLPKQIFAHGWLVMKDGKMSKSMGNVIYPEMLIDRYGLDATRYFLLREMSGGNDSVFTPEGFIQTLNSELSNDLGNLLNRTIAMINKYFDGEIPTHSLEETVIDSSYEATVRELLEKYHQAMDQIEISEALDCVMAIVSRTNKYIDETEPWVLAKDEDRKAELASVMYHLADSLRVVSHLLRPVIPHAAEQILEQLGLSDQLALDLTEVEFNQLTAEHQVVKKGQPLFPRLEMEEEMAFIQEMMRPKLVNAQPKVDDPSWNPEEVQLAYDEVEHVEFDQFIQTELKVAEVMDVVPVKGSNKLLRFRLDAGDEGHRQILSGIAKYYPQPDELIGEKVAIVANLKPRKMMGYISQGMILSTEANGELKVVTISSEVPNGTLLG